MIGFWATLSLNIPDFSRYARTQRDQIRRPGARPAADDGALLVHRRRVTTATTIIFGEAIWDPVDVLTKFRNPMAERVAMFALCIATLATNIAANVV